MNSTSRFPDSYTVLPFALFWMISFIRVVGAAMHRETFGAEATLALLVVIAGIGAFGRAFGRALARRLQ